MKMKMKDKIEKTKSTICKLDTCAVLLQSTPPGCSMDVGKGY